MDLSGLKWPVIIIVVVGVIWLGTSGGINFMYDQFTKAEPGVDPDRDRSDEAWLTSIGGYLMKTFQYEKAFDVMDTACYRYGEDGVNYFFNQYRMAKCLEKMKAYQEAYDVLIYLKDIDANQYDDRVQNYDQLNARAAKLKEVHQLE